MFLENVLNWNDFTPEFRSQLRDKVLSYGKKVRYKFEISHENPDPTKHNGPIVYPSRYTLDPITFRISDSKEKRPNKAASKQVGMIESIDENGKPKKFHRIRILEREKGIKMYDLDNEEDLNEVMYLELHPKLVGGQYQDKNKKGIFRRIDEQQDAKERSSFRELKAKALSVATVMDEEKLKEFAAALLWDETEEVEVLRDRVEELSETNPKLFTDLIADGDLGTRANIKKALDLQVISFDPIEYKFMWADTQHLIINFGQEVDGKTHIQRFAEWVKGGEGKSKEAYARILSLI